MHFERAEGLFVERVNVDNPHRAATARQHLDRGALLTVDQVADRAVGQIADQRILGVGAGDPRAGARHVRGDNGQELVRRPVEEQLKLAMLVDRA